MVGCSRMRKNESSTLLIKAAKHRDLTALKDAISSGAELNSTDYGRNEDTYRSWCRRESWQRHWLYCVVFRRHIGTDRRCSRIAGGWGASARRARGQIGWMRSREATTTNNRCSRTSDFRLTHYRFRSDDALMPDKGSHILMAKAKEFDFDEADPI